jgi:predicted transcriptional regulator
MRKEETLMRRAPLGELEQEMLLYIADHYPVTVGEAYAQFAEPRGLARSTIATVMDHLVKKDYLERVKGEDGVYHYTPRQTPQAVLKDLVRDFVENTLGGRISPFMAYLDESPRFTEEEQQQLRRLLERLEAEREAEQP